MPPSTTHSTNGAPLAANDNPAPGSWDEALAMDLAILRRVADAFGWPCGEDAPGW